MDIKLKLVQKEQTCVKALLKKMGSWRGSISMDLPKGELSIVNAQGCEVDMIIEEVSKVFYIIGAGTENSEDNDSKED